MSVPISGHFKPLRLDLSFNGICGRYIKTVDHFEGQAIIHTGTTFKYSSSTSLVVYGIPLSPLEPLWPIPVGCSGSGRVKCKKTNSGAEVSIRQLTKLERKVASFPSRRRICVGTLQLELDECVT